MNIKHYQRHIIDPALMAMGGKFYSRDASILLCAIMCHESARGEYIAQLGGGPAAGLFQIESDTARDIIHRYLFQKRPDLKQQIDIGFLNRFSSPVNWPADTENALRSSCLRDRFLNVVLARLKLAMDPKALPKITAFGSDEKGIEQAIESAYAYYKRIYNSPGGDAELHEFKRDFPRQLLQLN